MSISLLKRDSYIFPYLFKSSICTKTSKEHLLRTGGFIKRIFCIDVLRNIKFPVNIANGDFNKPWVNIIIVVIFVAST